MFSMTLIFFARTNGTKDLQLWGATRKVPIAEPCRSHIRSNNLELLEKSGKEFHIYKSPSQNTFQNLPV